MTYSDNDLLFVPLGGSGEIGMNVNLYHYRGRWIMVDLGISFPDENTPALTWYCRIFPYCRSA